MTKFISISKLSNSFTATAGAALILAVMLMTGFQYAEASTVNILSGSNLTVGSTGEEVVVLQGLMSEMGYIQVPSGVALGYFGPLTRDAVSKYQSARGVAPTAGFFGPLSKIALHEEFLAHGWLTMMGW